MAEKRAVSVRLTQAEHDILDALSYLRGKSNHELLYPIVVEFLSQHATAEGVKEAVAAKEKARQARAS